MNTENTLQKTRQPIVVRKLRESFKQDKNGNTLLSAELAQTIVTHLPSAKPTNSLNDSLYTTDDYNLNTTDYDETRVCFIVVPANQTIESVQKKIETLKDACIAKTLSYSPILSEEDLSAIESYKAGTLKSEEPIDLDYYANKQAVRYGKNSENEGKLILHNGFVQYKRNSFHTSMTEDKDLRDKANVYMSEALLEEAKTGELAYQSDGKLEVA
jgi:hypothetical protein